MPVSLVDLACPPCSTWAAASREPALTGDGRSLVPLLEGGAPPPRPVLAEYTAEGAAGSDPAWSVTAT